MSNEHYDIESKKRFVLPVLNNKEFARCKNGNKVFKTVLKKLPSQYQ